MSDELQPIEPSSAIELSPEDPAYIEQMIARAEGREAKKLASDTSTEASAPSAETSLLAGKFKTPADLEKAYKELEAKLGQKAPADPQTPPAKTDEPITIEHAKDVVAEAGLDFAPLEAEFRETGDLSDESRAALEKRGIGKEMVDAFLVGQRAAETLGRQKVFETVGGETQYREMITWARTNLPQEEIDAFNAVAKGSNFAALRLAAAGLYARFEAKAGKEPTLVGGGSPPAADVYQSWAQVREAMSDPRYDRDDAFRRNVEQKLARSSI